MKLINGCSGLIYKDDQFTECHYCEKICDRAIRCAYCGTVKGVFYKSRGFDLFLCMKCHYREEKRDV
jgi:hypothetical protein